MFGADVGNGAAESPLKDGDLDDAGPDSGDGLGHEHGPPWNLHVLAQFQILGEVETLGHCDVAVGLEKHHGHRTARLNVSGYEFSAGTRVSFALDDDAYQGGLRDSRKNVQPDLDTGHALNETNWDKPDDGNDDRYEESPPMHGGRISQAHPQ